MTVAQAVHWFDTEKFYSEVDRVLRPSGCVAVLGYALPLITSGENKQKLSEIAHEVSTSYSAGYIIIHQHPILACFTWSHHRYHKLKLKYFYCLHSPI